MIVSNVALQVCSREAAVMVLGVAHHHAIVEATGHLHARAAGTQVSSQWGAVALPIQ